MLVAIFQVMALRLVRDRGAFALAFILPGAMFAIFATIFAATAGGDLNLRVALAVETDDPELISFAEALRETDVFAVNTDEAWTEEEVRERVRLGLEDAGLVITGSLMDEDGMPFLIVEEPSREIAAISLVGEVLDLLTETGVIPDNGGLFERASALPDGADGQRASASVAYYAGATAILFILFSAVQGASISLEEKAGGVSDRLLVSPLGAAKMLGGKFAFLTVQGVVQTAVIFLIAWALFGVAIWGAAPVLLALSVAAAAAGAGIALAIVAFCATPQQAHAVSTFLVLVISAVGGSMVPRFMMPDWLQSFGRATPNAWAIDGFYAALARGAGFSDISPSLLVLGATGLIFFGIAAVASYMLSRG